MRAEAFSATIYPDEEFPATGVGRICLLCQQSLSDSAAERFERFRQFLRDTTQKDALRAETELAATVCVVSAVAIPVASDIEQQLQELTDIKPAVITRTDRGVGYIGVALSKTGREPTSRILSEGEFRGLALACFFAEIESIDGHDGIIVDDPVSSLDHLHVTQVAKRLVQEAQARPQVVVFTHDLPFYYDLLVAAREARIPLHRNWIYTDGPNGFGKVASDDGPWQVKKVRERLPILEAIVKSLPDSGSCPPAEYQQKTEEFYSKLRETWERVVEEGVGVLRT